ncbi:MAG: VWA domain-containing protein [Bryobacteraceae bacterium]|nr:VWA domain-containing protein [Bryobacteraceae bacterium]
MKRRTWLAAPFLLAQEAPCLLAQELPTIRVNVKLVRVQVTVKSAQGEPVGGLKREDFAVEDKGVPQEIAIFERSTAQPLSVSLLIDTSLSTATNLEYQSRAIQGFLRALFREGNPGDRASLYSFQDEVRMETGFTRTLDRILKALSKLKPDSGTSLYDALWFAAHDLERRDGRRVLVVVTDGGDTTSRKKYRDAIEAAQRADAVIYSILVVPIAADVGRNIGGENALATLAANTGGRIFQPTLGKQLDAAFAAILSDLRTQYLLGYYPRQLPTDAKPFHPVRIRMTGATVPAEGLQVLARNGYYGDSD